NTAPTVRLAAVVDGPVPPAGRIAFASQSGAFGIAALEEARARGVGISSFVSLGNKADLSGNDVLQYWEQDDGTDVVLLYLESFGNPQKFGAITRRLARRKPVAIVKSARTAAGVRAAASHTGALLAAAERSFEALFAHAGVIRVETLADLFDVGALLAAQPLPPGDRVAIVTNAGGPGTVCADACVSAGLLVDPPSAGTRKRLRAVLPPQVNPANPVDLDAPAGPGDYRAALDVLLGDDDVDAAVAIIARPLEPDPDDVAVAVREAAAAARDAGKPVLAVLLGRTGSPAALAADGFGVPSYPTPEEAARALGHARRHARRRALPVQPSQALADVDADAASAVVARALAAGGGWLAPAEAEALFRAYGVPVLWSRVVGSPHAAGRAAAEAGGPVAVKAVAPDIPHKADVGAVLLGVEGAAAGVRAAREVAAALERLGRPHDGYVVQTMAPAGVEMLVGVSADPRFGPLVACGAGGPAMELLGDVQVRLAPLSPAEADEMVRSLRTFPLLDGHRGAPVADVAALVDVVVRVAALAAAHPEIAEVDCHPVLVSARGAVVADSRVRIEPPPPPAPFPALRP
ncbi:MAG TPA: acetate--CoA ligase family protein, partial [Solirubrobacteraceae bacterium]|nr:acetate--CoA ligase family protein [Solirubrobacteraceae bacterium]